MNSKANRIMWVFLAILALLPLSTQAQQTLGSINGTVTDSSGGVVGKAAVKVKNVGTNLEVTAETQSNGSYNIADLPIGTYTVTISKQGFKTEVYSQILVQGNRATTVNASLQPGEISTTITVTATPMLNQTDTTNGYTLQPEIIENMPLGTGSFTQLAILAPGVNAELLAGSGTGAGLGNQSIWANGQRDTSNSFTFNGVNATNVFNGKSSSSLSANRVVLNTGESFQSGGDIQTNTSVYGAIGEGLPSPPQETIQELHVITSMYDASQGANSGAHIEVTTKSGTNDWHGGAYEYHQTDAWNAAPFFRNAAGLANARPALKRNTFGGTIGGPIKHDKLFFFASYQGQRVSDGFAGSQQVPLPVTLTSDRSAAGLAAAANAAFGTSLTASQINPVALAIMQAKLPSGQLLVPNPQITDNTLEGNLGFATVLQGNPSRITADQLNGNIDYNFGSADRLAGKYYFQRDPTSTPFTASADHPVLLGFPQILKAGSQVFSLGNTSILTPNLTWEQRFGFIREIAYGGTTQQITPSSVGISAFSSLFPSIQIGNVDSNFDSLAIGPGGNFANAGVFQNQFQGTTDLNWVHGRHNISTGFSWIRNQLNVINKQNGVSRLSFKNFATFLTGSLCGPTQSCSGLEPTELLNGASSRYYRTSQAGAYVQDDFKILSNLTIDVGLRWDWDGPLVEKNGNLTNFYPKNYSYNVAADQITNIGLVIAGDNSAFGTKGVSNSTLTGGQWGFGPRIGLAWSPTFLKNFVVRTGFGMYYDRGEFFTELSPSAGGGNNGPFGVTVEEPFVVPVFSTGTSTFANPFGTTPLPPPPTNLLGVQQLVPNVADLIANTTPRCQITGQRFCGPLQFAGYDPRNKLPYSENWTLDLQWQPINTLVLDIAYVGNHGVHEVLPIPFNQAFIATPQKPALAQNSANIQMFSYGYNVPGVSVENVNTLVGGFGTGNVALRVPFIGFDPNSQFNEAEGISNYNALQIGVNKRLSRGLLINASYTWSHSLDEGSGLGLFFNGNDPLNPKSAYGSSDFDRTHVFTVSYVYDFPRLSHATGFTDKAINGWGISGVTVLESGQPYSVIDFSGGVASIFWGGGNDLVTNPIVPIGGAGASSTQVQLQGTTGINAGNPVLNPLAFGVPAPFAPGTNGVPPCDLVTGACDTFENGYSTNGRNLFRGPFQTRFDFSVFKDFKLTERFKLRYDAQFFNLFNHPSFDTPNNNVLFNPFFNDPPTYPGSACIPATNAFQCPPGGHLGLIQHTLGSPRFIQMALHLTF